MKSTLSKALAALALGVLGMLAFVGPSHAARFIATIDPAFDFEGATDFPNIGFRGTATFNVPGGCLSGSDGWYSNFGTNPAKSTPCFASDTLGGRIEMESAYIELYHLDDLGKVASATFGSSFSSIEICSEGCFTSYTDLIDRVLIIGSQLAGIDSQIMLSTSEDDPGNIFVGQMGLSFFTECTGALDVFACHDPAQIHLNSIASNPAVPQQFSITQIPEPTTLSLLLAALGASVLVLRRRRSVR